MLKPESFSWMVPVFMNNYGKTFKRGSRSYFMKSVNRRTSDSEHVYAESPRIYLISPAMMRCTQAVFVRKLRV